MTPVADQSDVDTIRARFTALEARVAALEGQPKPEPPPEPPPPPPPVIIGETLPLGDFLYEELHVHEGKTLTVMPGTNVIRRDVSVANPDHGNGGIVAHGTLIALRKPGQPEIVFRSENPAGIRGHMMFHGRAELDGVDIVDMGRTRLDRLGPENPLALYAAHWHLAGDSARGSRLENCRIWDTVPGFRYGVTVHGSNGVTIRNNHIHHKAGAGIFFEDGTERDNLVQGCTIEDILGRNGDWRIIPDRVDSGGNFLEDGMFGGYGIGSRGPMNRIVGNTVRRCGVGYIWFQFWGANREQPILEFRSNTAEDCFDGMQPWFIGGHNGNPPAGRSVIERFTARRCLNLGVFGYPCDQITYTDCLFENAHVSMGDYFQNGWEFKNSRFVDSWLTPSTATGGETLIENCQFENGGIRLQTLYSSGNPAWMGPRIVRIRNCRGYQLTLGDQPSGGNRHYTQRDECYIDDTYRVYPPESAPDHLLPQSEGMVIGCPEAGLTNAQAWERHGVAWAGSVAPADAVRMPWTNGLVTKQAEAVR